jgi:integrase
MTVPNLPPGGAADARPATFAEALARLTDDATIPPDRLRELRSAFAALERVTGQTANRLPMEPRALRPLLEAVLPARYRMSGKRWANVRSGLAAIGTLTGHVTPRTERRAPLRGIWAATMATLTDATCFAALTASARGRMTPEGAGVTAMVPRLRSPHVAALTGFARFCQANSIAPDVVDEAALEAYRAFLFERTYDLSPGASISAIRRLWNSAVGTVPGWPGRVLLTPANPHRWALPMSAFPPAFAEDVAAYCAKLGDPDPFEPRAAAFTKGSPQPARPLAEVTIADRRRFLTRAASALVKAGTPIDSIDGLAVLTTPTAMKTILSELYQRAGKAWNGHAVGMAIILIDVAGRHLNLPADRLQPLLELKAKVKHRYPGLTDRVRGRLSLFDDPQVIRKFLVLPAELFAAADRLLAEGCPARAAGVHERGLALALLQLLPMRRRNLAAIDIVRHFRRDANHRIVAICIPGTEVKNGITLDAAVPVDLARRIDRHIKVHRLALARTNAASSWLFAGMGDDHRCPEALTRGISAAVRDAVGVQFNVHLIRHLVATLLYDADPLNGPLAQRVLGHTQLKTTEGMYGSLRTRGAQRQWAEVLDSKRDMLRRQAARKGGKR